MKNSKRDVNMEIIAELTKFINKYPELRFNQILWILDIVSNEDRFYEPSNITLEKVKLKTLDKDI